jgi:diadenosine tetraphosphate (Ap4A) HIT family hydrolase
MVDLSGFNVPGITDLGTLACLARARGFKQYKAMREDAIAGKCPFCSPLDPEKNKVTVETELWLAWESKFPEKHTRLHILAVPKRHVASTSELTPEEEADFLVIKRQIYAMYQITYCGILCRDGDARMSAGTVGHLHFHFMVADGTGRLESPFYKGDAAEAEGIARAIVFEKLLAGAQLEELTPEEQALVKDRM